MPKNTTDFFWTDATQASERLRNSLVTYDGNPCYVSSIEAHEDGVPRAWVVLSGEKDTVRKKLNSPKFNNFRVLPTLGWFNLASINSAMLVKRRVVSTRTHGIADSNTACYLLDKNAAIRQTDSYSVLSTWNSQGFKDCTNGKFPPLNEILLQISKSSAICYNPYFCVARDSEGVRWLYRLDEKIGLFTSTNSLYLLSSKSFYREEIQNDPSFTLDNIQEF